MVEPLTVGAMVAGVGAILGLGRLQQKVANNTKTIAKLATDEKLDLVHESLEGRLVRIERKLDTMNGNG